MPLRAHNRAKIRKDAPRCRFKSRNALDNDATPIQLKDDGTTIALILRTSRGNCARGARTLISPNFADG